MVVLNQHYFGDFGDSLNIRCWWFCLVMWQYWKVDSLMLFCLSSSNTHYNTLHYLSSATILNFLCYILNCKVWWPLLVDCQVAESYITYTEPFNKVYWCIWTCTVLPHVSLCSHNIIEWEPLCVAFGNIIIFMWPPFYERGP